jgi:predicted RNA-binding protein with PIN domain
MQRWLIDGHNVIGSRPDGWWRDRDRAARRLVAAVRAWAAQEHASALLVLDAGPDDLAANTGAVEVAMARGRGRDAGDDELVRRLAAEPEPGAVTVVTSDAALAARARVLGAAVEGARRFRDRLPDEPC